MDANEAPESRSHRQRSASRAPHSYQASFSGSGNEYFEIAVLNWVLSLLTLGLYGAWARIRTYRFFYASTHLGGYEFRFTGDGWPLFKGLVLAGVFLGAVQVVFIFAFAWDVPILRIVFAVMYVLFLIYLGHYAYFRARRYRFAHTTYRQIRFRLDGSPSEFAMGALVRSLGALVTLGLLYPLYLNYVYRSIYNNLSYGTLRFRYTGDDDEFMRLTVPGFVLVVLTLGVYYFWWYPRVYSYRVYHLHVEGSRLHTDVIRPFDLFKLRAIDFALTVFTLGVGAPFAAVRSADFFVRRLRLEGTLDLDDAEQTGRSEMSTIGEGLADELDVDVDLGF